MDSDPSLAPNKNALAWQTRAFVSEVSRNPPIFFLLPRNDTGRPRSDLSCLPMPYSAPLTESSLHFGRNRIGLEFPTGREFRPCRLPVSAAQPKSAHFC